MLRLQGEIYDLWHPHYYQKKGILFAMFRLQKSIQKRFLLILMMQNLLAIVVLISFTFSWIAQLSLLLLIQIILVTLIWKFNPFANKFIFYLFLLVQALFIILYLLYFIINLVTNNQSITKLLTQI